MSGPRPRREVAAPRGREQRVPRAGELDQGEAVRAALIDGSLRSAARQLRLALLGSSPSSLQPSVFSRRRPICGPCGDPGREQIIAGDQQANVTYLLAANVAGRSAAAAALSAPASATASTVGPARARCSSRGRCGIGSSSGRSGRASAAATRVALGGGELEASRSRDLRSRCSARRRARRAPPPVGVSALGVARPRTSTSGLGRRCAAAPGSGARALLEAQRGCSAVSSPGARARRGGKRVGLGQREAQLRAQARAGDGFEGAARAPRAASSAVRSSTVKPRRAR